MIKHKYILFDIFSILFYDFFIEYLFFFASSPQFFAAPTAPLVASTLKTTGLKSNKAFLLVPGWEGSLRPGVQGQAEADRVGAV